MTHSASRNGYSYVHGNPVNLTDPSGEIVFETAAVGVIMLLLIASVVLPIAYGNSQMYTDTSVLSRAFENALDACVPPKLRRSRPSVEEILGYPALYENPEIYGNPEPKPEPTFPPIPYRLKEKPDDDNQDIVLSLGPGWNMQEIEALLAHYPNDKIVAIDNFSPGIGIFEFLEASNPRFDYIKGSISDPTILSENGYGKAKAAFSVYPTPTVIRSLRSAFNNLVETGGDAFVVTELNTTAGDISKVLDGIIKPSSYIHTSRAQMESGTYGSPSIPFVSSYNGTGNDAYYLWGIKQ